MGAPWVAPTAISAGSAILGGMGGKGGDDKTSYNYPPQLNQMFDLFMPVAERLAEGGQLWDVPQAPSMFPGGKPAYDVPSPYGIPSPYEIPDVMSMMPSRETYDMVSPQVKAGLWAPYEHAQKQLMETLGHRGMLGNQRAGYTGAAGAAIGELMSRGAEDVGLNVARLTMPQLQRGWEAELGRGQQMWGAKMGRGQQMWGADLGREQALYGRDIGVGEAEWGGEMERWRNLQQQQQMPYSFLPSMMGGMTQPMSTTQQAPGGFDFSGMLSGGMTGMMAGKVGQKEGWW